MWTAMHSHSTVSSLMGQALYPAFSNDGLPPPTSQEIMDVLDGASPNYSRGFHCCGDPNNSCCASEVLASYGGGVVWLLVR